MTTGPPTLTPRTIDRLTIDDERSFRHVGLYADLKEVVREAGCAFRVMPRALRGRWDHALLLNLTYWSPAGGDVLVEDRLAADVVTHTAWHHLAARAFPVPAGARPSGGSLLLGEAIASSFDVYLIGRLLGHAPRSTFLSSQVSAMAEVAEAAGCSAEGFEGLLQEMAADPAAAFADLRALLFDAATGLLACAGAEDAVAVLAALGGHRFAPILHHYELSNWVLYARAYGAGEGADPRVLAVDQALREAPDAIAWLEASWVRGGAGLGQERARGGMP